MLKGSTQTTGENQHADGRRGQLQANLLTFQTARIQASVHLETLMLKLSLLLGTGMLVLQLASPSWAQKAPASPSAPPSAPTDAEQPNPPYPGESHITFQWNYSCPAAHACSFRCPGAGGATSVTTLDIYLGVMPTGADQHGLALFYNFVTQNIPRGNGFSVTNGTAILSCQVNGMKLDYSGPPK
jgi:hypothetical protein